MARVCQRIKGHAWAVWDKPATGDPMAPFDDPTKHWDKIRFHSDLQYLNDALSVPGISLTHQSVAGTSGTGYAPPSTPGGGGATGSITRGQVVVQTQTLYTHGLGYVPEFTVKWNGTTLYPGMLVYQDKPAKTCRFASAFATSSIIGIRTVGISSSVTLPSQATSYDLTIFRQTAKIPGAPLAKVVANDAEDFVVGYGRVTSALVPLRQAGVGDVDVIMYPIGPCVDIREGAVRTITVDGNKDFGGAYGYYGGLIQAPFIRLAK